MSATAPTCETDRLSPTGTEEEPLEAGLKFYEDVFTYMKEKSIEPLVTLHHYEQPIYLADNFDGWYDRRVIDLFLRFCRACFERYGHLVKYWLTFNEIDSVFRHPWTTIGFCEERYPAEKREEMIYQSVHNQFVASALATKLLHQMVPGALMGCMLTKTTTYPLDCNPANMLKAQADNRENMFYADVQARGRYPQWVKNYWRRESRTRFCPPPNGAGRWMRRAYGTRSSSFGIATRSRFSSWKTVSGRMTRWKRTAP